MCQFKHKLGIDVLNVQINITLEWIPGDFSMLSQRWFGQWLGAVMRQAITRSSIDQDLQRHMVPLGHNGFVEFPYVLCTLLCDESVLAQTMAWK